MTIVVGVPQMIILSKMKNSFTLIELPQLRTEQKSLLYGVRKLQRVISVYVSLLICNVIIFTYPMSS